MVNGTNFCIFLNDGAVDVMIDFRYLSFDRLWIGLKNTCFAASMILSGNIPLVKLRTSLSVTSDFRFRELGFLTGWGM